MGRRGYGNHNEERGRGKAGGRRPWQSDPEKVEQYSQAVRMRSAGASYPEIARAMGWRTPTTAYNAVKRMLDETRMETVDQLRDVEGNRLDRLLMAWYPLAIGTGGYAPNPRAAEIVLRIIDRRVRLYGLNAPEKIDITATIRQMAERDGLDPEQAVHEAEDIIRSIGGG